MIYKIFYQAPFSELEIINNEDVLLEINFINNEIVKEKKAKEKKFILNNLSKKILKQLDEYFNQKRKVFDLPLKIQASDFEKKVYKKLCEIKFGDLRTYKEIAELIDNPKACRAVGNANAKNKIPIIIPCHRVIATNNAIAGYNGGVDKKAWLLKFEGHSLKKAKNGDIFL